MAFFGMFYLLVYFGLIVLGVYFVVTTIISMKQRNEYLRDIRDELRGINNQKSRKVNIQKTIVSEKNAEIDTVEIEKTN